MLLAICTGPTDIQPETPAAAKYALLESTVPQIDPGELSIISLAIEDPDITPVWIDRRAIYCAVEELRGWVLSFYGFLGVLRSNHGLPAEAARLLSEAFRRTKGTSPPLWW